MSVKDTADLRLQLPQIEDDVRQTNLIFRPDIQILLKQVNCTRDLAVFKSATHRLEVALDAYKVQKRRTPDAFRPYGPEVLLRQGNILLLIQQDSIEWRVPVDSLLTGVIVIGPQQSGKTRFIINLCREIQAVNPDIVITIIDPKDAFRPYASMLRARRMDLRFASFSLSPPTGVSEEDFVLEFMPPLADTAGLIYGIEPLTESALIALDQLKDYRKHTGLLSELSLRDIHAALPLVKDTSSGRRQGYREAAQTSLRRILGEKGLFACRRGISVEELFSTNTILDARSLTDDMQCRALALFLLYWESQRHRYQPETNRLAHLIICDDATRWFSTTGDQFSAGSKPTPLAHVLALLRSTGTGLLVATQLPALLDALSRTMVAVGPTSGSQHLKVISDFMHLNDDQAKAITRLSTREIVAFAPGTAYKEPVHGWAPLVDDPLESALREPILTAEDLGIEPWRHLTDLPPRSAGRLEVQAEDRSVPTAPPSSAPVDHNDITRDGLLEAWEICLTTSHVLTNITKYQKTTHRIVLLARTYELSMAIKGLVKGSGLDPELIARVEYLHISQLLRRSRKLSQY